MFIKVGRNNFKVKKAVGKHTFANNKLNNKDK